MGELADADGGFLRQTMFEHLNGELTLIEALTEAYIKGYGDGRG